MTEDIQYASMLARCYSCRNIVNKHVGEGRVLISCNISLGLMESIVKEQEEDTGCDFYIDNKETTIMTDKIEIDTNHKPLDNSEAIQQLSFKLAEMFTVNPRQFFIALDIMCYSVVNSYPQSKHDITCSLQAILNGVEGVPENDDNK